MALGYMAARTQTELMIRQVQFIRRTKMLLRRQRALEMPEEIIQKMEVHGSITKKMAMRFLCFDHITAK